MRQSLRLVVINVFLFFLASATLGGLFWADLQFARRFPGGESFLPVWKAAQNYAVFGVSPYEEQTLNDIQFLLHKRPAYDGESLTRVDLPFYTLLTFIPIATIQDFAIARALWMLINQLLLVVFIIIGFRLIAHKPPIFFPALFAIAAVFWAGGVFSIISGDLYVLNFVLVFAALLALHRGIDEAAGAFLALATFCIEPSILLIAFILFWAYTAKRWRVWSGLLMALIILIAAAFLMLPSWGLGFARTLYLTLFKGGALFTVFDIFEGWWLGAGSRIAWGWIILLAILLGVEWAQSRRRDQRWMVWTSALTIACTPLIGLPIQTLEYTLMLFPLMVFAAMVYERWGRLGLALGSGTVIAFFIGTWALIAAGSSVIFPIASMMIVLLYWVRWWAVRPPRVWVDTLAGK
jgi:hypothetical protein